MMPVAVKMSAWQQDQLVREPTLLTAVGLRETLLVTLDYDEARVNFVCRRVEETGTYELEGLPDTVVYTFEKILHS